VPQKFKNLEIRKTENYNSNSLLIPQNSKVLEAGNLQSSIPENMQTFHAEK